VVIPYYPLSDEMIGIIARLQLGRIEKRIRENHKVPFTYDDEVVKL
jgi:type VI secretion system protein VasG